MKTMIFREKTIILSVIVIFLLMGFIFHLTPGERTYQSVGVVLTFENIHRGEYPDGANFRKDDLIDDGVLEKALSSLGGDEELESDELEDDAAADMIAGITPSALRPHLEVEGVIPGDRRGYTEDAVDRYYPNEYMVNLHRGDELGLSSKAQDELLKAIVKGYVEKYRMNIGMQHPLPDEDELKGEVFDYDYPFWPQILNNQVDDLIDYAESLDARDSTFSSDEHGYTYSDVIYYLQNLQDRRIDRLRSFIRQHNLSDEPDATLERYQGRIKDLQVQIDTKEDQASYARGLLADTEDTELVADLQELEGVRKSNIIEDLLRHEYYPELLMRSLEAGVSAQDMRVDLDYYRGIVEGMEGGDVPGGQEAEELKSEADEQVEEVLLELAAYGDVLDDMRSEMLGEHYEDAIQVSRSPREIAPGRGLVMNLGLFFVVGVFVGVGAGFIKYNWNVIKDNLMCLIKDTGALEGPSKSVDDGDGEDRDEKEKKDG